MDLLGFLGSDQQCRTSPMVNKKLKATALDDMLQGSWA